MSAPQDHYLLLWAFCHGGGEWVSWEPGSFTFGPSMFSGASYGQFQFLGTPFVTRLDKMGVPVVTKRLREAILESIQEARMADAR